jgi:hypothetical protein
MSFKLFVYYCAVCGAWFGLAGWLLGRLLFPSDPEDTEVFAQTVVRGLSLGTMVALGLGALDGFWNLSSRHWLRILARGIFVALVGCLGGLIGAATGQALYSATGRELLVPFGWLLTGLLIGASVGAYDVIARLSRRERIGGAWRKVLHGVLGGSLGGLLGGLLYLVLGLGLSRLFRRPADEIYSSTAWGFVALGACIGLFIGLAQIILKEAWVRVEAGFRPGRELILSKDETTIGRAESCDIGLFGDAGIERLHARIILQGNRYLLADAGTPGGTYLNDQQITQTAPLRSGDLIRVGNSLLRFGERPKKQSLVISH